MNVEPKSILRVRLHFELTTLQMVEGQSQSELGALRDRDFRTPATTPLRRRSGSRLCCDASLRRRRTRRSPPTPLPHRRGRFGRYRPPRRRRAPRRRRPAEPLPGRSRRAPLLRRRSHALRAAISAGVRRQVWQRDGGRCSYVDPQTGRRCNSTHLIEIDYIVPHALGGGADPGNLRLLCGTITATGTRRAGHRVSLHRDRCLQGRASVGLTHTKPGRPERNILHAAGSEPSGVAEHLAVQRRIAEQGNSSTEVTKPLLGPKRGAAQNILLFAKKEFSSVPQRT